MKKTFQEFLNEGLSDIDKILDKMNATGKDSLTANEKELLAKYSRGEDISKFKLDDEPRPVVRIPNNNVGQVRRDDYYQNVTRFDVGDEVALAITDNRGLSEEVYYYLRAQKTFTIRKINANGKIDVGARTANGAVFYLNPVRFKLVKPNSSDAKNDEIDPFGEENWPQGGGNNNNNRNQGGGNAGNNNIEIDQNIEIILMDAGEEFPLIDNDPNMSVMGIVLYNGNFGDETRLDDYIDILHDNNQIIIEDPESIVCHFGGLTAEQVVQRLIELGFNARVSPDDVRYWLNGEWAN